MKATTTTTGETPQAKSIEEIMDIAEAAFHAGEFLFIEGRSGGGKSTIANVIADRLGIAKDRRSLANFNGAMPSQVRGQLMPDPEKRESWYTAPTEIPLRKDVGDEPWLQVIDELPACAPEIQALFHGLLSPDGIPRIGDHELPKKLFVILTGNRRQDAATTNTVQSPIIGRSACVEWLPSIQSWIDHEGAAAATSPIAAFLKYAGKAGSDLADFFCPAPPKPWRGSVYPQPRKWSKVLHGFDKYPADPARQNKIIAANVGQTAADACCAFITLAKSVLPILDGVIAGTCGLPRDPQKRYSIAHCAIRRLVDAAGDDAGATLASGALDPIIEKVILPLDPEMRAWAFDAIKTAGVPIDQHPLQEKLQNLSS